MAFADKAGLDIGDTQRAEIAEEARVKATLSNLVNQAINDLTGTAMGEKEAQRIMAGMPSFDDSPAVFAGKLQAVKEEIDRRLDIDAKNPLDQALVQKIDLEAQPAPVLSPIQQGVSDLVQNAVPTFAGAAQAATLPQDVSQMSLPELEAKNGSQNISTEDLESMIELGLVDEAETIEIQAIIAKRKANNKNKRGGRRRNR